MREIIPSVIKLFTAAFSLAIIPTQTHALTPSQVFDKVKDSIVVVKTLDAQGKVKGQGSGVLISSGRVATNCHVVEGGASYQVSRGKQIVSATLYAEDGDKDICILDILDVSGNGKRNLLAEMRGEIPPGITGKPAQLGKAADLKVGASVYAVGAPQGLELSLSDGIVAQLRGGPPPLIQTTAAISPGSSGGGLFDEEGRLVGLTTLYIEGGQNLNFAMPVEWIDDIKPGRKPIAAVRSHTEWLKRAMTLEQMKNWQEMRDWCQQWAKNAPTSDQAWYGLGNAYRNLKHYTEAIDALRQALFINPEYFEAWNNLGIAYSGLSRYDDAIKVYRQSIRINPKDARTWNNLGVTYNTLNQHSNAIKALRQAIQLDPEYVNAWNYLGDSHRKLKHYDDAIDAYRQALRINPEHLKAWNGLGGAYHDLKRYDEAIDAYRQAIRIDPENAIVWSNLGFDYFFSGNRAAALDVVQKLRRLDPTRAEKLFNLIVPR